MFDSGLGGLGVWREVVRALPGVPTVYLADQAHAPYGGRSLAEIRELSVQAVALLLDRGADVVVVACNTASAAALHHVRAVWPQVPFVGMEPAIKPAVAVSPTGVVGVLATAATLAAPGFRALVERYAAGIRVVAVPGHGLVEAVEAGDLTGPGVRASVEACVAPLRAANATPIVLGCTHYPFLRAAIEHAAGPGVTIVDPAPAVARRTASVWWEREAARGGALPTSRGDAPATPAVLHRMLTSGDPRRFRVALQQLVPGHDAVEVVGALGG